MVLLPKSIEFEDEFLRLSGMQLCTGAIPPRLQNHFLHDGHCTAPSCSETDFHLSARYFHFASPAKSVCILSSLHKLLMTYCSTVTTTLGGKLFSPLKEWLKVILTLETRLVDVYIHGL